MFKPTTLASIRPLAETLTSNQLVLQPKAAHYPVGVLAAHFEIPQAPSYQSMDPERFQAVAEKYQQSNKYQTEDSCATFDALVEKMALGVRSMLTKARAQIVPLARLLKEHYEKKGEISRLAQLEVQPVQIHAIHQEANLTSHLVEHYARLPELPQYRSFILPVPEAETLIDWLARNRHVDEQTTREWALGLGSDVLKDVFRELFTRSRSLTREDLSFTRRENLIFNLDRLLVAYFLTGYLVDEPQDLDRENVSLAEWELALKKLHGMFGALLLQAYQMRARARARKQVVWRYEVENPMVDGRITVYTNADVYQEWLEQGGDVKMLLGAALVAPARRLAVDLENDRENLIAQWEKKHYLIRQARLDLFLRTRRQHLRETFSYCRQIEGASDLLPPDLTGMEDRLEAQLRALREEELDDPMRLITKLVCEVFYPGTTYRKFFEEMDRAAGNFPDLTPREAATLATVEMVTQWLASQVQVRPFTPDVRAAVVSPTPVEAPVSEEAPSESVDAPEAPEEEVEDETPAA